MNQGHIELRHSCGIRKSQALEKQSDETGPRIGDVYGVGWGKEFFLRCSVKEVMLGLSLKAGVEEEEKALLQQRGLAQAGRVELTLFVWTVKPQGLGFDGI